MKKVVIVGGGTGPYVVTQGLKDAEIELTKIVTVFDSGGSTKRLMDEFGFQPVGDLRQSLAALAKENGQSYIRDLLLYRFSKGKGLAGHNLGNLILTALQDMTGSTPEALRVATKIFKLKGKVLPVTTHKSDLITTYEDGTTLIGEHELDLPKYGGRRISRVSLTEKCTIYSESKEALEEADYIIFGPGDIYASIVPNMVVSGAKPAIARSKAKLIYIINLMTRYTQTHGFTAKDHVEEMEKYVGRKMDYVILNTGSINPRIKKTYAQYKEFPVINDLASDEDRTIITGDFASSIRIPKKDGDTLPRSLMRHDKQKLTQSLLDIIKP